MSQSTPEEEIALLNAQKQSNLNIINNLNNSILYKQNEISNYTLAIGEFQNQITAYETNITTLENDNLVLDNIIAKITPPVK